MAYKGKPASYGKTTICPICNKPSMCICCGSETREFEPDSSGEFCIDAVLIQVYLTGKSPTARQGRLTGDLSETVSDAMKETMTGFTANKKK